MLARRYLRHERLARRATRHLWLCFTAVLAGMAGMLVMMMPSAADDPLVTVYAPPDCMRCRRWMAHLEAHGFRTMPGPEDRREMIRDHLRLPPGFPAQTVATVNGRFVAGLVPVGEIHRLIEGQLGHQVMGVAVHADSFLPWGAMAKKETRVFAVLPGGVLRPVKARDWRLASPSKF